MAHACRDSLELELEKNDFGLSRENKMFLSFCIFFPDMDCFPRSFCGVFELPC
jgi:hypothetical protein